MNTLFLDFETFSRANLKLCGGYQYAMHATTEILVACWAIDDGPVQTWVPGLTKGQARELGLPDGWQYGVRIPAELASAVRNGYTICAHNAQFERAIWQAVVVRRHGGPKSKRSQFVCTAARSAASGLPRSLDGVASALEVTNQKDKEGARLLKLFAMVRKPTKTDKRDRIKPADMPADFILLCRYCAGDVEAERDVDNIVPPLHPSEQRLFEFDMLINERGLRIDTKLVAKTSIVIAALEAQIKAEVNELTKCEQYPEGLNPTQGVKIKQFFWDQGVELENLKKDYLNKYMLKNAHMIPDVTRRLLMLRMEASKASTKKLASMLAYATNDDERARGTLLFSGAHTGRWCLEKGTELLVKGPDGRVGKRKIENLRSSDLLWDGVEWVTHEGVMNSGVKETIEHDGVRASADHMVWVSKTKKVRLADAKSQGLCVWKSQPWAVYCLTFSNGKRYIGVSTRPNRRFADHMKHGRLVKAAAEKHGLPIMDILEWVDGKEMAFVAEREYIEAFKTRTQGYNLTAGGEAGPGFSTEVQKAASLKGVEALRMIRTDPKRAAILNKAVAHGIANSAVFIDANRAKAIARRGVPSSNPEAARASIALATATRVQRSKDMHELGLLKKQKKPVPVDIKNARIAVSVKEYMGTRTTEQKKAQTSAARKAVVWDDERRTLQRHVMSKAIKAYWEKKHAQRNI